MLVQIKEKAQITLPLKIRELLSLAKGDFLEVALESNIITLTPKMVIDKQPEAVLSERGNKMLDEALADVKQGKFKRFNSAKDLIKGLKA